jgi:hypothetical protein
MVDDRVVIRKMNTHPRSELPNIFSVTAGVNLWGIRDGRVIRPEIKTSIIIMRLLIFKPLIKGSIPLLMMCIDLNIPSLKGIPPGQFKK